MPRPRAFNRDEVIERAIRLFGERGYEATSIRELVEGTGISSSSMYETFGDKRGVFLAALERFCEQERAGIARMAHHARTPDNFIEQLFGSVETAVHAPSPSQASLAFNAMVEFGTRDVDITRLLLAHHEGIAQIIAAIITRGQQQGTVTTTRNPVELAYTMLSALHGLAVVKGVKPDFPHAAAITRLMLHLLHA